jgi:polysaccharide pyruvyl transferase WcaK-like protein
MRRINYLGWLGFDNLGDEALYRIIQDIFDAKAQGHELVPLEVGHSNQEFTSPVTIWGGSTGIPEWVEWLRPTEYSYIFGAGVKDPAFYGDFDSVVIDKLKVFRYIGVRGNISKTLLKDWGIKSEVIGDPCLSLRNRPDSQRDEMKIGVNIGSDGILWGHDDERVLREVARFCRILRKRGHSFVLIPFWKRNVEYVKRLSAIGGTSFVDNWLDTESTLKQIAECKVFIGEKLHSLVFSAAVGTPFICLEYQPKCFDFSESVGLAEYSIRTDNVTSEKMIELFDGLMDNYERVQRTLVSNTHHYRERQRETARKIVTEIQSLNEDQWLHPRGVRKIRNKMFWGADFFLHRKGHRLWQIWNRLFFLKTMRYLN